MTQKGSPAVVVEIVRSWFSCLPIVAVRVKQTPCALAYINDLVPWILNPINSPDI